MGQSTGNGPGPAVGLGEGTQIHTRQGLKAVEQIEVGDWVLACAEDDSPPLRRREAREYTFSRVTRMRRSERQPLVRITVLNAADGIR